MEHLLAVSRIYHSAPSHTFPFFLIGAGGVLGFVALVAGIATLLNHRDDRRHGAGTMTWAVEDERSHAGGPEGRPWEDAYRRRGVDAEAQLAEAEAAGVARSARSHPEQAAGASNRVPPRGTTH